MVLLGAVAGIIWLWLLTLLKGEAYDDILTLATVFVLYFTVESINGSGVIFALVFGLMLGNSVRVARVFRIKRTTEATEIMKKFHSQTSFFIKTFFFIYLGLIITFNEPGLIIHCVVLSILLLFSRYLAVLLSSLGSRTLLADRHLLTTMLPRGLSAAVLAQIVVTSGIPNVSVYPDIIIVIILITVTISAIGIPIFTKKAHEGEPKFGISSGNKKPAKRSILPRFTNNLRRASPTYLAIYSTAKVSIATFKTTSIFTLLLNFHRSPGFFQLLFDSSCFLLINPFFDWLRSTFY